MSANEVTLRLCPVHLSCRLPPGDEELGTAPFGSGHAAFRISAEPDSADGPGRRDLRTAVNEEIRHLAALFREELYRQGAHRIAENRTGFAQQRLAGFGDGASGHDDSFTPDLRRLAGVLRAYLGDAALRSVPPEVATPLALAYAARGARPAMKEPRAFIVDSLRPAPDALLGAIWHAPLGRGG